MRNRRPIVVLACLACLVGAGCGGDSGSTPTPVPVAAPTPASRAAVSLTVTPSPVIADATDQNQVYLASFTITFTETAGLGANIDFFNVTMRNPLGYESATAYNHGADEVIKIAGTNHVAAKGTLVLPFKQTYWNGMGTRGLTLILVAQVTDERGNRMNVTNQVECLRRQAGD